MQGDMKSSMEEWFQYVHNFVMGIMYGIIVLGLFLGFAVFLKETKSCCKYMKGKCDSYLDKRGSSQDTDLEMQQHETNGSLTPSIPSPAPVPVTNNYYSGPSAHNLYTALLRANQHSVRFWTEALRNANVQSIQPPTNQSTFPDTQAVSDSDSFHSSHGDSEINANRIILQTSASPANDASIVVERS